MRSRTATAPSSENRSCGRATQSGVGMPASRSIDLADGLSQASRDARASQPTYGTPQRSSTPRSEPSSPVAPCRAMTTASGGSAVQRRQQGHVGVALFGVHPGTAQRVQDPATGPQRHVPLVGQSAGEHQNAQIFSRTHGSDHAKSGPGASAPA